MKATSTYFAGPEVVGSEFGSRLFEKIDAFYKHMDESGRIGLIRKMHAMSLGATSNGTGSVSWRVSSGGEQGELLFNVENHFANIGVNLLNLITTQRPTIQAEAANTDKRSIAQTLLGGGLVEYHMDERQLETDLNNTAKRAIFQLEGWLLATWDTNAGEDHAPTPETVDAMLAQEGPGAPPIAPQVVKTGEPRFEVLGPLDIARDVRATSIKALNWVAARTWVSKYELAAQYPDLADKILGVEAPEQHKRVETVATTEETDLVPLWHFFHKKTAAVPEGRQAKLLAADVVLYDGPLAYSFWPAIACVCDAEDGRPFGWSPMVNLLGPQDTVNGLHTAITSGTLGRGVGNILVPKNANLSIERLNSSMNSIEYDGQQKPEPLEWPAVPSDLYQFKKDNVASMETLSGINSVVRGNPSEAVGADASGAKLALIEAQAMRANSGLEKSWVALVRDVAMALIKLYRDFGGSVPRLARIAGKANQYLLKDFTADDLSDIDRVKVEMANPILRTVSGRLAVAEKAVELQVIKPGEFPKFLQLLKTGTDRGLYETEQAVQMRIAGENERLMEGGQHRALISDPHWREIPEHLNLLDNPAIREPTPENEAIQAAVLAAVQEHMDLFMQMTPAMVMMRGGPEAFAMWQSVMAAMAPPPMPGTQSGTLPPEPGATTSTPPPSTGEPPPMSPEASKPELPGMPSMPSSPSLAGEAGAPGGAIQ